MLLSTCWCMVMIAKNKNHSPTLNWIWHVITWAMILGAHVLFQRNGFTVPPFAAQTGCTQFIVLYTALACFSLYVSNGCPGWLVSFLVFQDEASIIERKHVIVRCRNCPQSLKYLHCILLVIWFNKYRLDWMGWIYLQTGWAIEHLRW